MKFSASRPLGLIALIAAALAATVTYGQRGHPLVIGWLHGNPTYRHPTGAACEPGGIVSGVIRNDGAGWYAIDDETHSPTNISMVESDARGIAIHFTFTADDIHTFIVASDESLTLAGVASGASVAAGRARLTVARAGLFGAVRTSPLWVHTGRLPMSNLWIYGRFTAACA